MKFDIHFIIMLLLVFLLGFSMNKNFDSNRGKVNFIDYASRQVTLYKRNKYSEALAEYIYGRIKTYQKRGYYGKQLLLWNMWEYLEKEEV